MQLQARRMVLSLRLISTALQQGQVHQLVDVQALINVNLKAALDKSSDLFVHGFPLRLAEIEDRCLLCYHLQRNSANNQRVQDDTSAPHVRFACYLETSVVRIFLLMKDLGRQIHFVNTAHLVLQTQMIRHIYQLHHGNVRDAKLDDSLINVQALHHDYAFGSEVLKHQVVAVQVSQLA